MLSLLAKEEVDVIDRSGNTYISTRLSMQESESPIYVGLIIPKVIPFKLFLDVVPSSSTSVTCALRGCFRGGFGRSLRFKAMETLQHCEDEFFYINVKETKRLYTESKYGGPLGRRPAGVA